MIRLSFSLPIVHTEPATSARAHCVGTRLLPIRPHPPPEHPPRSDWNPPIRQTPVPTRFPPRNSALAAGTLGLLEHHVRDGPLDLPVPISGHVTDGTLEALGRVGGEGCVVVAEGEVVGE